MKRVLELFGPERIEALVADREFIGTKWFQFLVEKKIPFVIRVKRCFRALGIREDEATPLGELCKGLRRKKILNRPITLWGFALYVSIQRKARRKNMGQI